ncbi:hypothetical protein ACS0TY_015273 [Phlomoides rotata]
MHRLLLHLPLFYKKIMNTQTESSSRKLTSSPKQGIRSRRCKCICLSVTAVILALGLLFLTLGLTVFKAKHPVIAVNSVALDDLNFAFDFTRLRVLLNVTLDVNISVKNPNRVGFKYRNSSAVLRYRGNEVGSVPVPAGRIGSDSTKPMNLTLTLMADRLISDASLYSDVLSGTIPFQTYVRISGHVRLLVSIHVVSQATCDFDINVLNRSLSNMNCRYKTKL